MIPSIGTPVWIRGAETGWRWIAATVAAHTKSGGRPAFVVDGMPGVFVDAHEGEFWILKPEAKGTP